MIKKYHSRVPNGYQEIEYLGSTGTQYIDTGITPSNAAQTKVQFKLQMSDITNGTYQSIGCNANINFTSSQTLLKFRTNAVTIANLDTLWHEIEMSKSTSGKITLFDGVEYSTTATTETALPFYLFCMSHSDTSYYGRYKLAYFKCYENDVLVRDMVPVKRINDNVLGMYDIVNDVFYTNQGSGTFIAGPLVYIWNEIPYNIYGTGETTLSTFPATIYTDGTNATAYKIYGNMQQTGTPTPTTPIQPQETGERTENLINFDTYYGSYKQPDGTYQTTRDNLYVVKIKPFTSADIGKTFTFVANISPTTGNTRLSANVNGTVINGSFAEKSVLTFTVETINDSIFFNYGSGTTTVTTLSQVMLVEGSTAPSSFIPYGIKIPISSANITTPVYLGEVETTRKIKKLVLTGNETIELNGKYDAREIVQAYFTLPSIGTTTPTNILSSHLKTLTSPSATSLSEGIAMRANGTDMIFGVSFATINVSASDSLAVAATKLKTYLATQYANGTPVCVWYVLATEETAVVNEPLRKIGDYADTVSGINIPTIAGANTFNVNTALTPSRADITYHGWHPQTTTAREYTEVSKSITSLPSTIHADGNSLESFKIYGNLSQSGTPSTSTPIYPSETGDRTENLCSNIAYKTNYSINEQGVEVVTNTFNIYSISCNPNTTYAISLKSPLGGTRVRIHAYNNGVWIEQTKQSPIQDLPLTFTTPNNADEIRVSITNGANGNIMLNTGSTILPYEPYGYKLLIQCGGVTTPVYTAEPIRQIGEYTDYKSESVEYRAVYKLVFDGTENWQTASGNFFLGTVTPDYMRGQNINYAVCSHYPTYPQTNAIGNVPDKHISFSYASNTQRLYYVDSTFNGSTTDFKAYLTEQYNAGTPVTVWYVLATPTTESISAPSIPTSTQEATIDIDTTLKPSKLDITYKSWYDTN